MEGHIETPVDETAAFWFARLRSDRLAAADRERFMRWLNADAAHAQAYARYQALWDEAAGAAADDAILDMRREALALAPAPAARSWRPFAAVAALLALLLTGGLFLLAPRPSPAPEAGPTVASARPEPRILRTAVGQRSTVTLQDGSVVELNTDSLVEVRYSAGRRDLRLVRGQAVFEVAHDRSRPFVVEAAGRRITALGTAFDVRIDGEEMRVTLIEGRVSVEALAPPAGSPAPVRTLRPGEQLIATADGPPVVLAADVQQLVSWRTGRLIFSDEPLGEVIGELNRYSERKIVLADASLAELRVSGVFRAGAVDSFVSAMDAAFPVAAEHRGNDLVLRWE